MGFVAFSSLKTLITHEKIIFAMSIDRKYHSNRTDLVRRLPCSLGDFTFSTGAESKN
jgi:hypothetical protein